MLRPYSITNKMLLFGLALALVSILAAIFFHFPFWYTPFLVGSFLFSDAIYFRRGGDSTLARIARGEWFAFALNYLIAVFFALVVDVWFGRAMAHAWVYPPYASSWLDLAVPLLLHYPLGMLALVENFLAVRSMLGGKITGKPAGGKETRIPVSSYGYASLVILALCLFLPPLNFYFNANRHASELLFVVMLVGTVAFDGARELFVGRSFGGDAWRGKFDAHALFVTVVVAFALNEGPNFFAREWVYTNAPFGIPLPLTLFVGWFFLLSVSLAVYETTFAFAARIRKSEKKRMMVKSSRVEKLEG